MKKILILLVAMTIFGINAVAEDNTLDYLNDVFEYLNDVGNCMDESLQEAVEESDKDFGATALSVPFVIIDCLDGDKDIDYSELLEPNTVY